MRSRFDAPGGLVRLRYDMPQVQCAPGMTRDRFNGVPTIRVMKGLVCVMYALLYDDDQTMKVWWLRTLGAKILLSHLACGKLGAQTTRYIYLTMSHAPDAALASIRHLS